MLLEKPETVNLELRHLAVIRHHHSALETVSKGTRLPTYCHKNFSTHIKVVRKLSLDKNVINKKDSKLNLRI